MTNGATNEPDTNYHSTQSFASKIVKRNPYEFNLGMKICGLQGGASRGIFVETSYPKESNFRF